MTGSLKIDDVAKKSGLSKRTIRYYEEIDLLPAPPRSEGGIRMYSEEHVDYLKRITVIKDVLGFSLQELQHFLSLRDTFENQRANYKKVKSPVDQKDKLNEMIDIIDEQLNVLENKIQKIFSVQAELISIKERARARVNEITLELEQS